MSGTASKVQISSVVELLAHAYQMELEAQDRYNYLAQQMDAHNNVELVRLFNKLAEVEGIHAQDILKQLRQMNVTQLAPVEERWTGDEPPESISMDEVSYLMTPRQALQLALAAERRAHEFFDQLEATTCDTEVKKFAAEFAEEEREHVELVLAELAKYPESEEAPGDDMDPPVAQG